MGRVDIIYQYAFRVHHLYCRFNKAKCLFFQFFTDGTTNKLVGCYLEDSPEDVVLVRVYGNKTELIVDRDNELKSFQVRAKTRISQDLDAEEQIPERFPLSSPLCRFSMLTAAPLTSTAPFTTGSATSSFTGKLWGRRMCGILQSSGELEFHLLAQSLLLRLDFSCCI